MKKLQLEQTNDLHVYIIIVLVSDVNSYLT